MSGCDKQFLDDQELALWLAFQALGSKFSFKFTRILYDRFQDIRQAWYATQQELVDMKACNAETAAMFAERRKHIQPESLLEQVKKAGVKAIAFPDPQYPPALRHIHEPPHVLYMMGTLHENDWAASLAVIGTRRPTQYGTKLAKEIARDLTANGAVVVSGLALGVDSLAHWGAIEGGGRTIAVVASGPDVCYPSSNKRLYNEILNGHGAVVSEYFPGTTPEKWRFPARNRIISGISAGTVVIEAGEESGALITAELAFEQSRTVFAVPGRIDSKMSIGTNKLIAKNVAHLITGAQDVLNQLNWVKSSSRNVTTIVELFGREKDIYEFLSNEPTHFDVICQRTDIAPGELSATLTMLELAGLVVRHPGDWYSRNDQSYIGSGVPQA